MVKLLKEYGKNDLRIFNDEFKEFLPEKIIDSHIHLNKKVFYKEEISEDRHKQNPLLDPDFSNGFTYEDMDYVIKKIFPGKNYQGLLFGLPLKEINIDESNKYISDVCKKKDCYGLYIPDPGQEEISDDFFKDKFVGFKPYPDLVNFKNNKDFSKLDIDLGIFDFISKKVLEFSQKHKLIVLIHIPRKDRLNDKRNIEEIQEISREYPDIKIVLAHAGRSYCYSDIKDSIKYLKKMENLYVDTAMINSFSVNKVIIEELGVERILYGSDLVVSALKGKNIDINNNHYFITKTPREWSLSSSQMELDNFTLFIYEIIRAIKIPAKNLGLSKEDINNIFYGNTMRLINEAICKS